MGLLPRVLAGLLSVMLGGPTGWLPPRSEGEPGGAVVAPVGGVASGPAVWLGVLPPAEPWPSPGVWSTGGGVSGVGFAVGSAPEGAVGACELEGSPDGLCELDGPDDGVGDGPDDGVGDGPDDVVSTDPGDVSVALGPVGGTTTGVA